jgi:hypothetical protein
MAKPTKKAAPKPRATKVAASSCPPARKATKPTKPAAPVIGAPDDDKAARRADLKARLQEVNAKRRGRPPVYQEEYVEIAERLCRIMFAIDSQIAEFFGVTEKAINEWKNKHPAFGEAIKGGKDIADARVERSLFERAIGFKHPAVKIMQFEGEPVIVPYEEIYPPDTAACIYWLSNRQKGRWRRNADNVKAPPASVSININAAGKRTVAIGGSGSHDAAHALSIEQDHKPARRAPVIIQGPKARK